ncbi:SpoIIE family protein phosphatase [candidate division KSB1 bacterium]|nr:SpoIIE family protein phosphatase [candidate division KSB1 bacterium]
MPPIESDNVESTIIEKRISIVSRFTNCFEDLKSFRWQQRSFQVHLMGAGIALLLIFLTYLTKSTSLWPLIFLVFIFFMISLIHDLGRMIRWPVELLVLLVLPFFFINKLLVQTFFDMDSPPLWADSLEYISLIILTVIISIIFIRNARGRWRDIIWLVLMAWFADIAYSHNNDYILYGYMGILFVILLSKTQWLDELTKAECLIYWGTLFFIYRANGNIDFLSYEALPLKGSLLWHTLPVYLFTIYKFYILILLIKIPFVLIYNHAQLSKKLAIAGFFQSTVPQFIQLFVLLLIFYFFLSGWQAENLRKMINHKLDHVEVANQQGLNWYRFSSDEREMEIEINDVHTTVDFGRLKNKGILQLIPDQSQLNPRYFLFKKGDEHIRNVLYCTPIDDNFLSSLGTELRILAGSTLNASLMQPGKWAKYIQKFDFIYQGKDEIEIFPFVIPQKDETPLATAQLDTIAPVSEELKSRFSFLFNGQHTFPCGRVFIHIWDDTGQTDRFIAFDIMFNLDTEIFWTAVPKIILFFIIIYLLLNTIIIQRVVRFGAQINESIIQKFHQLKVGIYQIASGNLDYKIRMEGEDEFVELGDRFNQMGGQLKKSIAELRDKDRLQYELQLARDVQLQLLPTNLPDIPGYNIAAVLETATEVGGDFYDFQQMDDKRFLFTIGDVSGKGSSAAFYMAQCMSLIRFSLQFTGDPDKICARLNEYFAFNINDSHIFVTTVIGILDIQKHEIILVRAGHTEPCMLSGKVSDSIRKIQIDGIGIGLTQDTDQFSKLINVHRHKMQPGETLVLYTDGVVEATRTRDVVTSPDDVLDMYGEEKFFALLKTLAGQPAVRIEQSIRESLDEFYNGQGRIDDYTLLLIQREI